MGVLLPAYRRAACVRFRPWVLVSLQGAAAVCAWVLVAPLYALRRLGAGGARAARVALLCALRSLGAGDAGCRCCVHLGAWVLVLLQGAAAASACYEARAKKPRELERNDSNAIWGLCWRNWIFFDSAPCPKSLVLSSARVKMVRAS